MNDFSVPMALVDYIPVLCFAIASSILLFDLYSKMRAVAFALFSAGVIDVTVAGALKATWKLLYAMGVCDFSALDDMFFPLQSLGFVFAGVGLLLMLLANNKKRGEAMLAAAPPLFTGTFVFVGIMVVGLGIMDAALCILSAKAKKPYLIALFALSFVCSLCMGYLSSQNFAEAAMNWIAEGVNILGQGSFLGGVYLLHKNGLAELQIHEEKTA